MATDKRLEEIRQRAEKATKGPWEWVGRDGDHHDLMSPEGMIHSDGSACGEYSADIEVFGPDATFIAHSREDIPYLLRELADVSGKLLKIREYAEWGERNCAPGGIAGKGAFKAIAQLADSCPSELGSHGEATLPRDAAGIGQEDCSTLRGKLEQAQKERDAARTEWLDWKKLLDDSTEQLAALRLRLEEAEREIAARGEDVSEANRRMTLAESRQRVLEQALRAAIVCPTCNGTGEMTVDCYSCLMDGVPGPCTCAPETCAQCEGRKWDAPTEEAVALIEKVLAESALAQGEPARTEEKK